MEDCVLLCVIIFVCELICREACFLGASPVAWGPGSLSRAVLHLPQSTERSPFLDHPFGHWSSWRSFIFMVPGSFANMNLQIWGRKRPGDFVSQIDIFPTQAEAYKFFFVSPCQWINVFPNLLFPWGCSPLKTALFKNPGPHPSGSRIPHPDHSLSSLLLTHVGTSFLSC